MPSHDIDFAHWEQQFTQFMAVQMAESDAAHDIAHIQRVVANAKRLAQEETADLAVVIPAAWLHDCVTVPKNSPLRSKASQLAAKKAGEFLTEAGYPAEHIPNIQHAVAAHSFSAGIPPRTLEAKVVQDADRLDAIGAIGIARCFATGGSFGTHIHHPETPFGGKRPLDDKTYSVDHFYVKLFKLIDMMNTEAGRQEAQRRNTYMHNFLAQLEQEIRWQ